MITELANAFRLAQEQPEDEQRQIARLVIEELEDHRWEVSPELATALAEARAEVASGTEMDFEEYDRQRRARRPHEP